MSLLATTVYTYAGLSRWALGFDNPNKAAVLFASLALVAFTVALRARRDVISWMGFVLFGGAAFALLHTFSRGGLIAFGVGALIVLAASARVLRSPRRWIPLLVLVLLAGGLSVGRGALGRLVASAPTHDASAGNRLVIWRTVPRMMSDAPGGWGLGNSGAAFMSWYQPLERRETYRTLVGSHFTWLVEFGRWGRCGYAAAWAFALLVCGLHLKRRRDPLPLALWACFGTASIFSSVAESWVLWILPGVALGSALVTYCRTHGRLVRYGLPLLSCVIGAVLVSSLVIKGRSDARRSSLGVQRDANAGRTIVGASSGLAVPTAWLVADPTVLGGEAYGRILRAAAPNLAGTDWGIADTLEAVPDDVNRLTLCGASADEGPALLNRFMQLKEVQVLSPAHPQDWLASNGVPVRVCCGEFAANCPAEDHPRLTVVTGVRDFLPTWPRLAFGSTVKR